MPIEFRCQACRKQVRAPDKAGGKRGKCPSCHVSVYVPAAPDESGEIGLAPLDEELAARQAKLAEESIEYAAAVDHEFKSKHSIHDNPKSASETPPPPPREEKVVDVRAEVTRFVRAMHQSKLDDVDRIAKKLKRHKPQARDYVQGLMVDQIGAAIDDIPPPLVQGFLKALLARLE